MQDPFLDQKSHSSTHNAVTPAAQLLSLLRRKELQRMRGRPCSCACTVLLPILLCFLVVIGTKLSDTVTGGGESIAPTDVAEANPDLLHWGETMGPAMASLFELGRAEYNATRRSPAAIPPLATYLELAELADKTLHKRWPPYNGAILAVTPNTSAVRGVVSRALSGVANVAVLGPQDVDGFAGEDSQRHRGVGPRAAPLRVAAMANDASAARGAAGGVTVQYFETEAAIEAQARAGRLIWAGLVFDGYAPSSNWSYTLRFPSRLNGTGAPVTRRLTDKFATGLSDDFVRYYASGFLSLQAAVNAAILGEHSSGLPAGGHLYGSPYPIPRFTHNQFFDHAGSVVGLVLVLSFMIPVSMMVRAIVLERESKLREQLLIMGTALPAYYGALATVHVSTFVLIALFAGCVLILGGTFVLASPLLVLAFFFTFAVAVAAFAAALTPFFHNAKVAAIVAPLVLFITAQFINFFLDHSTGVLAEGMAGGKRLASMLPATAFYLGTNRLCLYEGSGQAVTLANAFEGDFSFGDSILALLFDALFWSVAAWYLDQVVPSEYGVQRSWYFPCTPSYWTGSGAPTEPRRSYTASLAEDGTGEGATAALELAPLAVEHDEPLGEVGVRVEGLRKKFASGPNNGVAVAGLDLQMRPGQITSLLGANGAGKTTTISMLTGLIPPTSGGAWIGPHSIRLEMAEIRKALGVCPQQNVLFAELSPVEHLALYGELKGLRAADLVVAIGDMLRRVGLAERAAVRAEALSGGQKRKLCLAIALLSSPTTAFLDEPTSGMDPHSRRAIWAMLRDQREGRTLVLTTHFLDEAEILSDRIAIMAEGRLRCVGSPLFLKARLGCGYRLTFAKRQPPSCASLAAAEAEAPPPSFRPEPLLALLRRFIPLAEITVNDRFYAEATLPSADTSTFPSVFEALDEQLAALGVASYGVTCTTLEDVFLRINQNNMLRLDARDATNNHRANADAAAAAGGSGTASSYASSDTSPIAFLPPTPLAVRDVHTVWTARMGDVASGAQPPVTLPAAMSPWSAARVPPVTEPCQPSPCWQYAGLVRKRQLQARRDCCSSCTQLLLPVVLVMAALALLAFNTTSGEALPLTPDAAFGEGVPRPTGLLLPPRVANQTWDRTAALVDGLAAQGWAPNTTYLAGTVAQFPDWIAALDAHLLGLSQVRHPPFPPQASARGPSLRPTTLSASRAGSRRVARPGPPSATCRPNGTRPPRRCLPRLRVPPASPWGAMRRGGRPTRVGR